MVSVHIEATVGYNRNQILDDRFGSTEGNKQEGFTDFSLI